MLVSEIRLDAGLKSEGEIDLLSWRLNSVFRLTNNVACFGFVSDNKSEQ